MLKIGEFSRLSLTTVKALRFYEKEGLLLPRVVDERTGYRFYETSQLETAAKIRSYRQLGLSIEEIKNIFSGGDAVRILSDRAEALRKLRQDTERQLSIIDFLLEERDMKYQVSVKELPEMIVYSAETVLEKYGDCMEWIPALGEKCLELNPDIRCAEPPYEFCEMLDGEYRETDVHIRHSEAVTFFGRESEEIRFRTLPAAKVLSIFHKGAYESIGEAYAYLMEYAEQNSYESAGLIRECYIDGVWNTDSVDDWLTEVQLPVK